MPPPLTAAQYLPKEYVNIALGCVFFFVSLGSFAETIRPFLAPLLPARFTADPFKLQLHRGEGEARKCASICHHTAE